MNTDADNTSTPNRRRTLLAGVLAAAAVALAIPVTGAFAGSGDSGGKSGRDGHRGDCPEHKDGKRSGTSADPAREL
ncbi:MAG: hypothetical protein JW895_13555 [Thermoleophilaceae bacterium]|nr:hypothetical protein [Thermoleophilaceae bacterium]